MSRRFKHVAKPFTGKDLPTKMKDMTSVVDVIDGYMCWSCEKYAVMAPTDLANGQYNPKTWKLNDVQGYPMFRWVKPYKEFSPSWMTSFIELRRLMQQALVVAAENANVAKFQFNNSMATLTVSNSTPLGEYRGDAMTEPERSASDFNNNFNIKVIAEWIGSVNKKEDQRIWITNVGTTGIGFKTFDGECLFISRDV